MKKTLNTSSDGVVVGLCVLVLVATAGAVGHFQRELAFRMMCERNLSSLGKAMLIYANDFRDELPKAGGRTNTWVSAIPDWKAKDRRLAYGLDWAGRQGNTTVTSSLYLLVKYSEVAPSQFVCRSDPLSREFKLSEIPEALAPGQEIFSLWDFGGWYDMDNNPSRHSSYAYHAPFGMYALTVFSDPAMAVLADRNPWMDTSRANDPYAGWAQFQPDTVDGNEPDRALLGNSDTHQWDGQNVLHLDSHVSFETRATRGVDEDNIYTFQTDDTTHGRTKGRMPVAYEYDDTMVRSRLDSVLLQEHGQPSRQGGSVKR